MTVNDHTFVMPLADEMNPLLGTRFHLTVYAPEPSSLGALFAGVVGFGGMIWRRRRR